MNVLLNINNLTIKLTNSHKYSNYTLFTRRETNYSPHSKFKKMSNINKSIKRPFSTYTQKISTRNFKKKSNNKLFNKNIQNIFSENQSSILSKNSSKSKSISANNKVYIEDYFNKKIKSKSNKNNTLQSILNLEKYYNPNKSFNKNYKLNNKNNKTSLNTNTNGNLNDLKYINQLYLTEAYIKKPLTKKDNLIIEEYSEYKIKNYSKYFNADILSKFKNKYNYDEILKTDYTDRMIQAKRRRVNICKEKKDSFMEKTRKEKREKLSMNSKKELYIRIKEIYQNKIEFLNDRKETLESWKNINYDFFENKIIDY